jgi:hypothetical protein
MKTVSLHTITACYVAMLHIFTHGQADLAFRQIG